MTAKREDTISKLSTELNHLNWNNEPVRALEVAEQLERVLGERTPESLESDVHSWILVAEARGDIAEAIRLNDAELARSRADLALGGYEAYPIALRKDVEYIQVSLELQALRHLKLDDEARARRCLHELYEFAEKYGIEPDEGVRELFEELNS